MMTLGPIGFMQPWILLALAALPAIWWLLRFTPPSPKVVEFPPTRLLQELKPTEETPARSPWWLTLQMMFQLLLGWLAEWSSMDEYVTQPPLEHKCVWGDAHSQIACSFLHFCVPP